MTNRFGSHAQFYWQFVIWARLVLLIVISLLPKILEALQRAAQGSQSLTETQLNDEDVSLKTTIWFHAAIAIVVIAIPDTMSAAGKTLLAIAAVVVAAFAAAQLMARRSL